jgi:hypothetical protein
VSDSIYVPSSSIKRWTKIFGVIAALAGPVTPFVVSWVTTRPSRDEMSKAVVDATVAARAAQSDVLVCSSLAGALEKLAEQQGLATAELWGQAVVERAYNNSPRRQEYFERARHYYRRNFKRLYESPEFRGRPAQALEQVLLLTWRPDRED